ncbi:hypothetical protein [Kitasatospora sp. NPDC093558]|uniref:hypothetical protein n=1 Tax=Kitasatospora sp. NPDC093558 TaxID=3155201 RepID=UPI00342DB225
MARSSSAARLLLATVATVLLATAPAATAAAASTRADAAPAQVSTEATVRPPICPHPTNINIKCKDTSWGG